MFLFQAEHNVTWIHNARGASAVLNLNNVTSKASKGVVIIDFDHDTKADVLMISQDRKRIEMYKKKTSYHKITWTGQTLFDIRNSSDIILFAGQVDYKISSFIVDDVNNDDVRDLIIGLDVVEDGMPKTVIIRAI